MIEASPELQEELALCDRWGIPHSFFLGGPFRWDELSQDKAVAYARIQRAKCRSCGTDPKSWDPDQGGDKQAFSAHVETCPGCLELYREQKAMKGPKGDQEIPSYRHIGLIPTHIAILQDEVEAEDEETPERAAWRADRLSKLTAAET